MQTFLRTFIVGAVLAVGGGVVAFAASAPADEITNWNQMLFRAGLVGGTTPLVITRVAAIVQAAVFDAVNGIDRRYTPIHVPAAGPARASRDAAAVQAAYATLLKLYPTQQSTLDARRAVSPSGRQGRLMFNVACPFTYIRRRRQRRVSQFKHNQGDARSQASIH